MNRRSADVVVLGAGPAGLAAAHRLGGDCIVIDARDGPGGLSMSRSIDGAVFDYGGHSFHTPHPQVRELVMDSLPMYEQVRDARVYFDGQYIPYPFQQNYRSLSNAEIVSACDEYPAAAQVGDCADFEEYLDRRFGAGVALHFMRPYNSKLWGKDLSRLATDWTSERIAPPIGMKDEFRHDGGKRRPLHRDMTVAYPAKGGFGEIFVALANRLNNIVYSTTVENVDPKEKKILCSNGDIFTYDKLVSTVPLDRFITAAGELAEPMRATADRLEALSLCVAFVVVNGRVDRSIQRIYSSEDHIVAHKIALNHNSSDYLRQRAPHAICFEMSGDRASGYGQGELEQAIVSNLVELGLVTDEHDVRKIEVEKIRYGYPVPSATRDDDVARIRGFLAEHDIHIVGRFGEWAYINSDEAMARGIDLAERLAS